MDYYKYIEDENNDDNDDSNDNLSSKSVLLTHKQKYKKERIKVFIRIRPFIQNDLVHDDSSHIINIDTKNISIASK